MLIAHFNLILIVRVWTEKNKICYLSLIIKINKSICSLTKCTSFEMNTLSNNQAANQLKERSRARRLAKNLNVTNLKKKLTGNFIKHCKLKRKTNQETSFIDCDNQQDQFKDIDLNSSDEMRKRKLNGNLTTNANKPVIKKWSNFNDNQSSVKNGVDLKRKECNPLNCNRIDCGTKTLDHNENFKNVKEVEKEKIEFQKNDSFQANFEANFDNANEADDKTRVMNTNLTNQPNQTDQNNKIINEFLLYTNKLTTDPTTDSATNLSSTNDDATSIEKSAAKDKNYYNLTDKLLDASTLANRNQSVSSCILDEDNNSNNQLARLNKNQFTTNANPSNCSNTTSNQSRPNQVILRRHVKKKEAHMDVKSARKQVGLAIFFFYVLFCCFDTISIQSSSLYTFFCSSVFLFCYILFSF